MSEYCSARQLVYTALSLWITYGKGSLGLDRKAHAWRKEDICELGSREGLERGIRDTWCPPFAFTCSPIPRTQKSPETSCFLLEDLLQISKRGTVTGRAGTWAAYICRLRWRDRPLWLVPRGHCTWIVKHQTTWAEDQGSQVLMSKTHEVYSLQNGFNNKNRIVGGCAMQFLTTEERS